MARDLLDLWQLVELVQRPGFLVVDETAHLELPILAVDLGRVVELVIGVERERLGDGTFREGRRQRIGIEDRRLYGVIEFRDLRQQIVGRKTVGHIASGQQRQRAKASAAGDEAPAREIRHRPGGVLDQQLLVDVGN